MLHTVQTNTRYAVASAAVFAASVPLAVSAQFDAGTTEIRGQLFEPVLAFSNNVLIPFILGIGFLVFVWGMFQYFIAGGANDEKKEAGKSLMVYATLGFVLIIIFWGVVNLLADSTGFSGGTAGDVLDDVKGVDTRTGGGG